MTSRRRSRAWLSALLTALVLLSAACATPIGVVRGTAQENYLALTANVLSAGRLSEWTMQVLNREDLAEQFKENPPAALAELHKGLRQRVTVDRLFALAEASFLHAQQSGNREYFLAAAAYAYAFVLPESEEAVVRPIDPRARVAVDLYNLGVSQGLTAPDGEQVLLEAGIRPLPFGELTLTVEPAQFLWSGYRFSRFVPVGEFEVRGLRNRYRQGGVGAALAAEVEPAEVGPAAEGARKRIPPRIKVPVTAFVRFAEPLRGVLEGKLQARIELYAADQATTLRVGQRDVPLELDPTAALAYQLEGAPVWDFEIAGFRSSESGILGDGLIMLHPYRPGQIPVVLVHGTASSPARWAEMYNELSNDPVLRGRFQFWLFQYNTGQPVLYSAMLMRQALKATIAELDPDGKDAAMRRMVMIGHSQGGLLTRLMAISSGTRFWDNVSRVPLEELSVSPETRALLKEALFFEPLPEVERVVFISTPHRGSFRASGWVLGLIRRFVTLPGRLVSQMHGLTNPSDLAYLKATRLPTSVENMSPGNPFIKTLAESPIDTHIHAHSIIAALGIGALTGRSDGVVAYESAHIEGVESEVVVQSSHSTQGTPATIEEVRRILREHLGVR
jgi:pimeloyl-ACP methyl ester carboxylesterase